jgi:hypothetical protein
MVIDEASMVTSTSPTKSFPGHSRKGTRPVRLEVIHEQQQMSIPADDVTNTDKGKSWFE